MPDEPATAPENEVGTEAEQTNVGRENMAGQGEWPDPDTPPTGPAGGETERDDSVPVQDPPPGSASQDDQQQTAESGGGTPGAARLSETNASSPPQNFKDVLEADPVAGGSASIGENEFEEPEPEAAEPAAADPGGNAERGDNAEAGDAEL